MPNPICQRLLRNSAIALAFAALPCALQATESVLATNDQAVTPEKNPPGDIPDTQAFVIYGSPAGFLQGPRRLGAQGTPRRCDFFR